MIGRVGRVWSGAVGTGRDRSASIIRGAEHACVCVWRRGGGQARARDPRMDSVSVTAQLVLRVYLTSEWTLTRDLRAMTTDI